MCYLAQNGSPGLSAPAEACVEGHLDEDMAGFSGAVLQEVACRTTGGITGRARDVFSGTVTWAYWPAFAQGQDCTAGSEKSGPPVLWHRAGSEMTAEMTRACRESGPVWKDRS